MRHDIVSPGSRLRKQFWWPVVLMLAVAAYLYGLDGMHIPKIGDEAPYIQTVRLTAGSGRLLPLTSLKGNENTKPPFLFWQGILSTDWGVKWTLLRLRLPIVVYTFLTAGLVFLLARRIAGDSENGYLGAIAFLGFFSTFQYGRPFLTNMPETFFVFLPFFLLTYFSDGSDRWGLLHWSLLGLSFGAAFLYKSFALIVPVGLALSWTRLAKRGHGLKDFLSKDSCKIMAALLTGLACFALWPLLDPNPRAVLTQFVLGENVGKLAKGSYLGGLFRGPYPIFRIWLGNFANAGFFALPLAFLVVLAIKDRAALDNEEKALWILILSFLIFFTIPSQRQENYLLPTAPALAVLLGVRWTAMKRKWFYLFSIPPVLLLACLTVITYSVAHTVLPSGYRGWQLALPLFSLLFAVVTLVYNRAAPHTFHTVAVLSLLSLSCALAPFHGPLGTYDEKTVGALRGKTVYIPSHWFSSYESRRFLLPGADVKGYDVKSAELQRQLLASGEIVAVNRPFYDIGVSDSVGGGSDLKVYGSRLTLKSRQTNEEISKIVLENRLDLLLQKETIVGRSGAGS